MAANPVSGAGAEPKKMVVAVPVADLRRQPAPGQNNRRQDMNQETQLLYGEKVIAYEEKGGWIRVEAIEQEQFKKTKKWGPYPGWIKKEFLREVAEFPRTNAVVAEGYAGVMSEPSPRAKVLVRVSLGTRLAASPDAGKFPQWIRVELAYGSQGWIDKRQVRLDDETQSADQIRNSIIEKAKFFLKAKAPYFWGGRSFYDETSESQRTSVDCSGLVHLAYGIGGVRVPRDAHEQFLKSEKIRANDLKTGDLIFLALRKNPKEVSHVMIYQGNGMVIEAASAESGVKESAFKDRLGVPLESIKGDTLETKSWIVTFGTYLKER